MKQILAFILIVAGLMLLSTLFGDKTPLECKTKFNDTNNKIFTKNQ